MTLTSQIICLGITIGSLLSIMVAGLDMAYGGTFLIDNISASCLILILITAFLYGVSNKGSRARLSICPMFLGVTLFAFYIFLEEYLNISSSIKEQYYILFSTSLGAAIVFGYITFYGNKIIYQMKSLK